MGKGWTLAVTTIINKAGRSVGLLLNRTDDLDKTRPSAAFHTAEWKPTSVPLVQREKMAQAFFKCTRRQQNEGKLLSTWKEKNAKLYLIKHYELLHPSPTKLNTFH